MPPGLNNDYVAAVVMMMEISSMQLEIMKSEGANCRYFVCRSFFSIFIWFGVVLVEANVVIIRL